MWNHSFFGKLQFIEVFGVEATLGPLPEGAGKNL